MVYRSRLTRSSHELDSKTTKGCSLSFGDFGLQAQESGWITAKQIEAARIVITRHIKRVGKVWIRIFPDKPITNKPAETRMGKGKGDPSEWVAVTKPGKILYELEGIPEEVAQEACRLASHKLPIATKFLSRSQV